ncbi:hypothetical protein [Bacillus fungorum]|uniref:hypothetical protein n=1 Tax=Bacillus fungorum TaxID=2039284 RepID=UPI003F5553FB
MKKQFKIGDWVVCEHNQNVFKILHFCNCKGLCVLPDNHGDWGDIEGIEHLRFATKKEIQSEINRRKNNKQRVDYGMTIKELISKLETFNENTKVKLANYGDVGLISDVFDLDILGDYTDEEEPYVMLG